MFCSCAEPGKFLILKVLSKNNSIDSLKVMFQNLISKIVPVFSSSYLKPALRKDACNSAFSRTMISRDELYFIKLSEYGKLHLLSKEKSFSDLRRNYGTITAKDYP